MSVLDQHASGLALHPPNAPRSIPQQHDVARETLYGEVFVNGANYHSLGLLDHGEQRSLGNRSAAGDRGQPAASTRANFIVHTIAVQVSATTAVSRSKALRKHLDDSTERFPREIAVRVRSLHEFEQIIFVPTTAFFLGCVRCRRDVGATRA